MDPQHRRQLGQTIHAAPMTGRSAYGDPAFGPPVSHPARVETTSKRVTTPAGEEAQADILVIVEAGVSVTDKLWLPGVDPGAPGAAFRIPKSVFAVPDERGRISHLEVYL